MSGSQHLSELRTPRQADRYLRKAFPVRDYERLPAHHETIVYWAMIITMSRRLARRSRPSLASGPPGAGHVLSHG